MNEREVLLQLIAGLTLCENRGDIEDEVREALKRLGFDLSGVEDLRDVRRLLHEQGVTTLWGASVDPAKDE